MHLGDINPDLFNVFQLAVVIGIFLVLVKIRDQLRSSLVIAVFCNMLCFSVRFRWISENRAALGAMGSGVGGVFLRFILKFSSGVFKPTAFFYPTGPAYGVSTIYQQWDIMDKLCLPSTKIWMMNYLPALLMEEFWHQIIKLLQKVNYLYVIH